MHKISSIKQVFKEFGSLKVGQLSAAFSYSALFSIGPLLLVLISVAGFILGPKAASGKLISDISSLVGPQTAKTIQNVILNVHKSSNSVLALVIGSIGLLLGAAGITSQLQSSFNYILGAIPNPNGGIKLALRIKIKNILVILVAGFVIVASVIFSALVENFGERAKHILGLPPFSIELLNNLISIVFLILVIYLLFKTLPNLVVPKKIALSAATAATILFIIGKVVLTIIIGRNGTASAYGAAASLISLLLWIYYSAEIIYLTTVGIKVYGDINSITYPAKKHSLKRQSVTIDAPNTTGQYVEAWLRGYRKKAGQKKNK
jgi:membrane protein